jgi:hypothetical protein
MARHPARQQRSVSIAAVLAIEVITAFGLDDGRGS